jgi:hypothetical protein
MQIINIIISILDFMQVISSSCHSGTKMVSLNSSSDVAGRCRYHENVELRCIPVLDFMVQNFPW